LKEIQEAEAKKAAKLEEAAAAARRALLEQELRAQPVAPAPGLPTTANWASGGAASPAATATPVASAWAKATGPAKAATPVPTPGGSKKTLAEIQKEEELRKQKLAAAALAANPPVAGPIAGGKRYADLASKPSASPPAAGGAWATVGAGGKVKVPVGPASATPLTRPASSAAVPTLAKVVRPSVAESRSTTSAADLATLSGVSFAKQEFAKWVKNTLLKGLNPEINGKPPFPIIQSKHR
jgi:PERQ amino acid-rich with GYF domain-containing protein